MGLSLTPEQASAPARVELATVTGVNLQQFSVDLMTSFTHRPLVDVPFMSPYVNGDHSGGVNVMPEVGAQCYVVLCGDGTSFVVGFVVGPGGDSVASEAGVSFRGLRNPMEPGDVMLGTRDRNFVVLRRGGIVEIGATSMAQRLYIPIQNTIRDYFQRYEAFSPLGEISWGHPTLVVGESVTGDTDSTPVLVRYSIKNKAQEDITGGKYTVEVRLGDVSETTLDMELDGEHVFANTGLRQETSGLPAGAGVLSFTIYSHVSKKVTYAYQLSQAGDCFIAVDGYIHVEADKDVYLRVRQALKVEFGSTASTVELSSGGNIEADVRGVNVKALSEVTISGPVVRLKGNGGPISLEDASVVSLIAGQIVLAAGGGGGIPAPPPLPVVRDNGFLAHLASHTHLIEIVLTAPECAAIVAAAAAVAVAPAGVVPILGRVTSTAPLLATATTAASPNVKSG